MALLNLLKNQGSTLSKLNGSSLPFNELTSKQSKMHGYEVKAGYSVDSSFFPIVNYWFQQYDDGLSNKLPKESLLDTTNNIINAPQYNFTHKYTKRGMGYRDNLPEGVSR
jgi:hypothetical protein